MKNLVQYGVFVLSVLLASSCHNPGAVTPATTPKAVAPGVTLINGRLAFNSPDAFKAMIKTLESMSEPERIQWDKQLPFVSLQEFYDVHTEGLILGTDNPTFKTQNEGDRPYIGDFLATRLMTQDGVVQIGDDVYKFQTGGKRLKTSVSVFNQTPTDTLQSVSSQTAYNVKLLGNENTMHSGAKVMVPDLPLGPTYVYFDPTHQAMGFFSQSGIWPFYTSFALKYQLLEYGGWWIFKSWKPAATEKLSIREGHLRLTSQGAVVLDQYGLGDACGPCAEARTYAGSVDFNFGGSVDLIQGQFDVTYNGQDATRLLP